MSLRWTEEELEAYQQRQGKREANSSDPSQAATRLTLASSLGPTASLKGKARRSGDAPPALDVPAEDEEQMALFTWANHMAATGKHPELIWLYHVPNGGSRGPAEAGRFKAMGVKSGVPDVALDEPRGGFHGLRIEMKRRQGGRVSPVQREWIDHYNQIGYRAVVCYGWDEAREAIEDYLRMEGTP